MGKESTVNNMGIHHTFFFRKSELKCKASLEVFFFLHMQGMQFFVNKSLRKAILKPKNLP